MQVKKPQEELQPHFSKTWHVAWELGLLQALSHKDLLVYECMVKHTDFTTGECSPTAGVVLRETGILRKGENPRKAYTQVARSQTKIALLGLFRRAGALKPVGRTQARRYYQQGEREIVRHVEEACDKGLLPARFAFKLQAWKHRRELRREAKGLVCVSAKDLVAGEVAGEQNSGIDWVGLTEWVYSQK